MYGAFLKPPYSGVDQNEPSWSSGMEPSTHGVTNAKPLADVPWWSISRGSVGTNCKLRQIAHDYFDVEVQRGLSTNRTIGNTDASNDRCGFGNHGPSTGVDNRSG